MSEIEVQEKPLPAVRLAARRAVITDAEQIGPVVMRLFDEVGAFLDAMGASRHTPVAQYDYRVVEMRVVVGYEFSGEPTDEFEIVELPAADRAVCTVHRGPIDTIPQKWLALYTEIAARGLALAGLSRELYVHAVSDDQADWVTELQQPVTAA